MTAIAAVFGGQVEHAIELRSVHLTDGRAWIRNVAPSVLAPSSECGFTNGEPWRRSAAGRCAQLTGCPAHLYHQPNGEAFRGAARCVSRAKPHAVNRFPAHWGQVEACDL